MSSFEKDSEDWDPRSESLFRAARSDHDPTALDRARVHAKLVRRLASGAALDSTSVDRVAQTYGRGMHVARLGSVLKISLGVAGIVAGSLVFMGNPDQATQPPPVAHLSAPASEAQDSAEPAVGGQDVPAASTGHGTPRAEARDSKVQSPAESAAPSARAHRPDNSKPKRRTRAHGKRMLAPSGASQTGRRARPSAPTTPTVPHESSARPVPTVSSVTAHAAPVATAAPTLAAQQDQSEGARKHVRQDTRAEVALVERIHAALRSGDPSVVLKLCTEHESRWPHGTFAEEREGVRAIVACEARSDGAMQRAQAFLARYPHTSIAPRVRAACAPANHASPH